MPWNPGIQYRGDEYLYKGITGAASVLSEDLVKTLQKIDEEKKNKAFGDMVVGKLSQTKGPDGQPYIPADALLRYEKGGASQRAGIVQGAMANAQMDAERQKAQTQQEMEKAHAEYFKAAAQGKTEGVNLNLSPEEVQAGQSVGKVPLRTSAKSFQWGDMPDNNPPDLDASGNPVYTADGTMYRSGGKFKPVTGPMMQSKLMFDLLKKSAPDAAQKVQKQDGFNLFSPSSWFNSGGQPAPSASPAPPTAASAAPAAATGAPTAYAPGTRARKGDTWYVMTPQGWQLDPSQSTQ